MPRDNATDSRESDLDKERELLALGEHPLASIIRLKMKEARAMSASLRVPRIGVGLFLAG